MSKYDWHQMLMREFEKRKMKSPSYSLRAFSRDTGVSQTQLSRLLNRTHSLGAYHAYQLARVFKMNSNQTLEFIVSTFKN